MHEFQARVVNEKAHLDGKLAALKRFFDTGIFAGLDGAEQERMRHQAVVMGEYSSILAQRIAAFPVTDGVAGFGLARDEAAQAEFERSR